MVLPRRQRGGLLCMILETRGTAVRVQMCRYGVLAPTWLRWATTPHGWRVRLCCVRPRPAAAPSRYFWKRRWPAETRAASRSRSPPSAGLPDTPRLCARPRRYFSPVCADDIAGAARALGYIAQPPQLSLPSHAPPRLARFRAEAPSVHPLSIDALLDLLRSARAQPLFSDGRPYAGRRHESLS